MSANQVINDPTLLESISLIEWTLGVRGRPRTIHFGCDAVAILFKTGVVARLPRSSASWAKMTKEEWVLKKIAHLLPLRVPNPRTIENPCRASIHLVIPGVPLTSALYHQLTTSAKKHVAEQLSEIFSALHRIDPSEMKCCPDAKAYDRQVIARFSGASIGGPWHALGRDLQSIQHQLKFWDHYQDRRVFSHFDLHGSNISFAPAQNAIQGVFDFLDCGFGDPLQDISKVVKIDANLASRVWKMYQYDKSDSQKLFPHILFHGILEHLTDMAELELSPCEIAGRIAKIRSLVGRLRRYV